MSDIYADINDDQPRKLFDAAGSFGTPARFDKVLASATDAQLKYKDEHKHTLLMRLRPSGACAATCGRRARRRRARGG